RRLHGVLLAKPAGSDRGRICTSRRELRRMLALMRTARIIGAGIVAFLLVASPASAWASDLKVTYLVDLRSLQKNTPAGTPLTFNVYRDATCTTLAKSQQVNVENVTLIEQPKPVRLKGAPKPPSVAQIEFTITAVPPGPTFYATVTGLGIVSVGAACQLQA